MPVNDRLSIGGGFNGPFGITTEPDNDNWAGKFEARSSKLSTYNLNPVMSYRMTSSLVVGAGAQFEFADTALKSAFPAIGGSAGLNPNVVIKGDSFGLGARSAVATFDGDGHWARLPLLDRTRA